MAKKRLYYYEIGGEFEEACNYLTIAVSEIRLPPLSARYEGYCANSFIGGLERIKIGDIVDIVMGDPIILKKCTLLSRSKKDVPKDILLERQDHAIGWRRAPLFTFLYRRKRIWVEKKYCCSLEKLRAAVAKAKKETKNAEKAHRVLIDLI